MSFLEVIRGARAHLQEQGRVSVRALRREFDLDDELLEELIEELVEIQQVAVREERALAWTGEAASPPAVQASPEATPPAGPAETRKIVTILFADLAGSTALHERLDPESARRFMESYYDAARDAVESHGGVVTQLLGDGVKAVFGVPRVAEDDAIRAVRAGVAMQEGFRALADRQRNAVGQTGLRVAVNTGEVVAKGESEIIGDPVNVAARLQEQGRDGDVVVGDSTGRLVEALVTLVPLGSFALKGRAEEVAAFRVESLEPPASAATAAFVGRDEEIARILSVYGKAVEKPATALAVLLGSPGLGKSRLIDEFTHRLEDSARFVYAHCEEATAATFAPVALALRELVGMEAGASEEPSLAAIEAAIPEGDADRTRIASGVAALLAGSPASLEETFFVVRRLLAALAAERPVVLVIDDLQWAEPVLLDLVEHLVEWGSDVPMLVLVGARPELRDKRASLATPGGLVADVVTLAGLDPGAAMRLAANVVGAEDLPGAVAAKVLATSEGNPLFVGELVRMLVHEGALTREGNRWTTGKALAALEMPPTIHVLLAARIERLKPEARTVLEHAAVVGRHFSRSALEELLPAEVANLDACLESLGRSELIQRDNGWFFGEPLLRFHHVLIRDAAYRQLLKGTRAELHTRFADWAVARAGESTEHDETIGWHLEQSHQLLRELGPLDARGREIGERAAQRLAAAGRRALAGDDVPLAASLLGRAIQRLDADDDARADLALDWCEALLAAGDVGPAAGAIKELERFVGDSERLRAWRTCFAGQHTILTAPERLQQTVEEVAGAATTLAAQNDDAGEAKAHYVHALALSRLGQVGACEASLDLALAAARRVTGDRRRANTVLAIAPLAALWGPSAVTRASGRCLDVVRVLRITHGAPAVEAVALSCQGVLEALRGRTEAARRMIASARGMVEELGITQRLRELDVFTGLVDLYEGEFVAAERSLRIAYDGLRELGLGVDAARAAALLARALLRQDRVEEAEALSHESEALAGDDLKAAIAWRGVRAEALARSGEHTGAVELASKAVEIAAATDALLDHAEARLALAAALRSAGRNREAEAEQRRANELWQAKGATLLAEHAQAQVAPSAPEPAARPEPVAVQARPRRRVRENAATAAVRRLEATVGTQDFAAVRALFRDDHVTHERPTGSTFGPDDAVASLERLFRGRAPHFRMEPLATLGDSLVLARRCWGAESATSRHYDVGTYENQVLHAQEVDERGLQDRAEVFADDDLNDAIVWLYERHAATLPEGGERERVATTARSIATMIGPPDLETWEQAWSPAIKLVDRRIIGHEGVQGVDAMREWASTWLELEDFSIRVEEVLCLEPNAALVATSTRGTARTGGGTYERPLLSLWAFGTDGRFERIEFFDGENEAEALECFDELTRDEVLGGIWGNAATRGFQKATDAIIARDLDGFGAQLALEFRHHDRTNHLESGREEFIATFGRIVELSLSSRAREVLATRGDRLALMRSNWIGGTEDVGRSEVDRLMIIETNEDGLHRAAYAFFPEDLDAAHAELDALWEAGEDREHPLASAWSRGFAQAFESRDWDALRDIASPDMVAHNHRLVGWGTLNGREAWVSVSRELVELSPDVRTRVLHQRTAERTTLAVISHVGTHEGGHFETPLVALAELTEDGWVRRLDVWDADRAAEALARFGELKEGASRRRDPFENAARRATRRFVAAFNAGDWEGVEAAFPPGFKQIDRRDMMHMELDRAEHLASLRFGFDMANTRLTSELLATRGSRLQLSLVRQQLSDDAVGPSEIEYLGLAETNERGEITTLLRWNAEDLEGAYAELDARFEAGEDPDARTSSWESVQAFARHANARDWDALLALCAPGFVEYDHRGLALLGTTRGAEAWVDNKRSLIDLASDAVYRVHHFLPQARGGYVQGGWYGRREGGDYELPIHTVLEQDEQGRIVRTDIYDDRIEPALARLAELAEPASRPDPFANAATRAGERGRTAWLTHDVEGWEALIAEDFRNIDHRFHLETGRDEFLERQRALLEITSARSDEVLATRGNRLALVRHVWQGTDGDLGQSEVCTLSIMEADEHGRHQTIVYFDSEDLEAARAELEARWQAGEARAHPRVSAWVDELVRCIAERDWTAMAQLASEEQVSHNHRLVGWGRRAGVEAWLEPFRAMVELSPDVQFRLDHLRTLERGFLAQYTWLGTREGGEFETPLVVVNRLGDDGRMHGADVWDPEQVDEAAASFAELAVPALPAFTFANRATRLAEENCRAWIAGDWDRFMQSMTPDFHLSDRRRTSRIELDRDEAQSFLRSLGESSTSRNIESEVLATRGEALALLRLRLQVAGGDVGPSEIVHLNLFEIDEQGRFSYYVRWDDEDVDAAYTELEARFESSGGASHLERFRSAIDVRDWDAVNERLIPDVRVEDHRLAGWGTLRGREALVRAVRTMSELAPDARVRHYHVRSAGRVTLAEGAWLGTRDGGPFESAHILLQEVDEQGRGVRFEFFDPQHLGQARARFEELSEPARAPAPNAAARVVRRRLDAWEAKDWERFAQGFAPDFRLSDRRRAVQLELGSDEAIAFFRSLGEQDTTRLGFDIIATRGERLVLLLMRVEISGADVGPSEVVHLNLFEIDERGDPVAVVRWDEDDLDAALAELDARSAALASIRASDALARIARPNAASAWIGRFAEGFNTGDWEAARPLFNPAVVYEDRQHLSQVRGDLETVMASLRERAETGARLERHDLIGTFGERVAVHHTLWAGGEAEGRFEMEFLVVQEVDKAGKLVATINFDVDDRRGAQREAWSRWVANEPGVAPVVRLLEEMQEAFVTKDRARWRAAHTDDLVVVDHRHAGLGRIEDPEIYTDSITAFWDMVEEAKAEVGWCWPAFEPHGLIAVARRSGTLREGGGEYELESLNLYCLENGRVKHVEFFEVDDLDHALARLEELRPTAGREPATPPPNAASGAIVDRWLSTYERCKRTDDWEPLRAMLHPDMVIEDCQRRSIVSGGPEQHVASMRERAASGQKGEVTVLTTAGEHLAMLRVLWSDGPPDGRFEIEYLAVVRVDASGRFTFMCLFDPDDRRTASATLLERYIASGARGMPAGAIDLITGWNGHDLERARRGLCEDLVLDDHRHTGLGRLEGADAYIAAVAAMHELAPDAWEEVLYVVRTAAHGTVNVMRRSGTNTEGGAFETQYAMIMLHRDDKISRFEVFELEQLGDALARFEELRPQASVPEATRS